MLTTANNYVAGDYLVEVSSWTEDDNDLRTTFDVTVTVLDPCDPVNGGTITVNSNIINPNPITYVIKAPTAS